MKYIKGYENFRKSKKVEEAVVYPSAETITSRSNGIKARIYYIKTQQKFDVGK